MTDLGDRPFSPEEIAETRGIISRTLKERGIRMEEEQLDVVMRRLLLQARESGRSPIVVAREMVRASAEPTPTEDPSSGKPSR